MAFVKLVRGSPLKRREFFQKTASTAFPYQTLLAPDADASGNAFTAATSSTERVLGALDATVVAADSDYASATRKPVLIDEVGEWEFAVGTGTADTNDEQGYIDLKDADEVDVTASTIDMVFVTRFVSTTKVRGKIVRWAHLENPANN